MSYETNTPTPQVVRVVRRRMNLAAYGNLLIALLDAQDASEQMKLHFADCQNRVHTHKALTLEASYRRSLELTKTYFDLQCLCLNVAVSSARAASINCGLKDSSADSITSYRLIFDLPTGQVSFDTGSGYCVHTYWGDWDASQQSRPRIEEALHEYFIAQK